MSDIQVRSFFQQTHLDATIGNNRFFNDVETFIMAFQPLIENAGNRPACVAANFFCSFEFRLQPDAFSILLRSFSVLVVDKRKVNDPFNG
jgi:hypothetical protein